jgi:hypothetical protein
MEGLILLVIVGGVLSTVLGAAFWGGIVWLGIKAAKGSAGQFPRIGVGGSPEFDQAIRQLAELIAQAQGQQGGQGPTLSALQAQFDQHAFKAQQHMRAFDRLSRERYESKVSGMLSDASAAGIDVSGWRY